MITLLIGATSVLAALSYSLQLIWQSPVLKLGGLWGWLRRRFLSLGFILTLGFLLIVSLTVSAGVSSMRTRLADAHPALVGALAALDLAASLLLVSVLFALIFRYMPARKLPWKVVLAGGTLTAVLFEIGRWAVGLYLAHSTEPSAFGAAASFVTLLLWLYYTAQIFLFGAEFTVCLGGLRPEQSQRLAAGGSRLPEAAGARSQERAPANSCSESIRAQGRARAITGLSLFLAAAAAVAEGSAKATTASPKTKALPGSPPKP
jgi:membrane protein